MYEYLLHSIYTYSYALCLYSIRPVHHPLRFGVPPQASARPSTPKAATLLANAAAAAAVVVIAGYLPRSTWTASLLFSSLDR